MKKTERDEKMRGKKSGRYDIRTGVTVILAAAAAVTLFTAGTVSWYENNRGVGSGDTVVSDNAVTFELGAVTNDAGTARKITMESAILDAISALSPDYDKNNLETVSGESGVICAIKTDDGRPLRPGSTGQVQFRLIPKEDGMTFYAQCSLEGFKKAIDLTDEENPVITYEMLDPSKTVPDEGQTISEKQALDLLDGHLLFFTDSAHTHLLDFDKELEIRGASVKDREYIVSFYWIWPRTYQDHEDYVGSDPAWQSAHGSHVLHNGDGDMGYNNGDQVIGEWVGYVMVETDVTAFSLNPAATPQYVTAQELS